MLAEIAAANAAFAVIKTAIRNGREIADVASSVGKYVNATEELRRKGEKKRRAGGADLEEFMHLEKLRQQEEELKQIMIYSGRPGLWHDWIKFQAEARKKETGSIFKCFHYSILERINFHGRTRQLNAYVLIQNKVKPKRRSSKMANLDL